MQQPSEKEIAAMGMIIEELERRRLVRVQKSGILSSICQNTEDEHGNHDSVRQSFNGRTGEAGV